MNRLTHALVLWLVFTISYSDFQRAVNTLAGEVVIYKPSGAGYTLFLLHERIAGHSALADATGADATNFDTWKSTCTEATQIRE